MNASHNTPHRSLLLLLILSILLAACPGKKPSRHAAGGKAPDPAAPALPTGPPIKIDDISFAGPAGHRTTPDFARGETVVCLFTISNFTYKKHKAHITADIILRGTGDQVVLRLTDQELVKGDAPSLTPGTMRTAASLPLGPAVPAGRYSVELTVTDHLGNRTGSGSGSFTLIGTPPEAAAKLTIDFPRLAADERVPAGAVVPISFEVRGFTSEQAKDGTTSIPLKVQAVLLGPQGQVLHQGPEEPVARKPLPFKPLALPREYQLQLPPALAPGKYSVKLEVAEPGSKKTSRSVSLPLRVIAPVFSVINLHIRDGGGLVRPSFLLGEQIFVRLSVYGLKQEKGEVAAAVDLAVAGPRGDVHLVRPKAATVAGEASRPVVKAGRFPVQLPLVLPSLAPTGKYQVVIRARDLLAKKEITRSLTFRLTGQAPKPMGSFKVDQLQVRQRADLPPIKGDTFGAGRTYHLALRAGGVKLKEQPRRIYNISLEGSLRLRSITGDVVHEQKGLFKLKRRLTYRPLRVILPAEWKVPDDVPGGMYDLEVSVLNEVDDMVSQLNRRVEVVGAAPAVPINIR